MYPLDLFHIGCMFLIDYAMTARRKVPSNFSVIPVDGLLMDRLSVIARNRGMGGRRLGPNRLVHTSCKNDAMSEWALQKMTDSSKKQDDTDFFQECLGNMFWGYLPSSG